MPRVADNIRANHLKRIRDEKRAEVLEWYMANNFHVPPEAQREYVKGYKGLVYWWLEPPIMGRPNPILIEEEYGDGEWTIRVEYREPNEL